MELLKFFKNFIWVFNVFGLFLFVIEEADMNDSNYETNIIS